MNLRGIGGALVQFDQKRSVYTIYWEKNIISLIRDCMCKYISWIYSPPSMQSWLAKGIAKRRNVNFILVFRASIRPNTFPIFLSTKIQQNVLSCGTFSSKQSTAASILAQTVHPKSNLKTSNAKAMAESRCFAFVFRQRNNAYRYTPPNIEPENDGLEVVSPFPGVILRFHVNLPGCIFVVQVAAAMWIDSDEFSEGQSAMRFAVAAAMATRCFLVAFSSNIYGLKFSSRLANGCVTNLEFLFLRVLGDDEKSDQRSIMKIRWTTYQDSWILKGVSCILLILCALSASEVDLFRRFWEHRRDFWRQRRYLIFHFKSLVTYWDIYLYIYMYLQISYGMSVPKQSETTIHVLFNSYEPLKQQGFFWCATTGQSYGNSMKSRRLFNRDSFNRIQ